MGGGVEKHFLGERVGEGAQGRLRGGVRRIPGNREEGEKGRREDEMPRLRDSVGYRFSGRFQPCGEGRMGHVSGGEVVRVHLLPELGHGGVDEEGWVRAASTAPDDVGRNSVVEGSSFGDDTLGFGGGSEVGTDVMESLGPGVQSAFLMVRL